VSIVLEHLSKRLSGSLVVDDVSLEIASGELFVLLGASGSGKSTILRLVAGLVEPDGGRIVLDGRDVTAQPPQQRGTGFVFQNYSIFRHMSVAQNVEFGLRIRRQPRGERARRRDELLELVGLSGYAARYPEELSGGQQQRVALARALAYRPSVLLLDEPFGALDVKIRAQLRRKLREIQRSLALTMILVTHDQEEAFEVADRVGVIERGRLLEVGSARELYARPHALYVGTFLGASNVLVGRVRQGRGCFGPLELPIPAHLPHPEGGLVQLLFRPEDVQLGEKEPASGSIILGCGRVAEHSFTGASLRVRLRLPLLPGTRQIAPVPGFGEEVLLVDALFPADAGLPTGEVWVSLRAWHILEPQRLRLLLASTPRAPAAGVVLSGTLAKRLDAHVTVLAIGRDARAAATLAARVEAGLQDAGGTPPQVLVHAGDRFKEILNRQAEAPHDLVILDDRRESRGRRLGSGLWPFLERVTVPVLIARGARDTLERLLICIATGEPGKSDVRVGGRLAQFLGAHVTLLHVLREGQPGETERAHLERAMDTFRALGVTAHLRFRVAPSPAEGILSEARERDPDLIVIGSHRPSTRVLFGADNITMQVLARAESPVLVVPLDADL